MAVPRWLRRIFCHYGVSYEEHHHPAAYSASQLAQAEHVSGHRVAKTVFLAHHSRPVSVVLPACARLDLAVVRSVLGSPELRLASEEEMARWFKGCEPGGVPPLRLRRDQSLLMDRALAHLGKILFPAGTLEDAVAVRFRDWWRMVRPGVGRFTLPHNGRPQTPKPPTVLVVEDERDTNTLFCRLLEKQGFACHGVEEGNKALAFASEMRPSAILLDLMLPDMSGFDVYERLRCAGSLRRPPVVIVSALGDEAARQRGRQLGADAYLTKPFAPEALVSELQAAVADAGA
jgi:CheY-like chemotaxis protein/prolyl-tRNA editing enzyme YbaK/EbsC (Cys-tRNA(Pro) deacylase)